MSSKKSEQERYMEMQMLEQQLGQIQQHIKNLEEKISDAKDLQRSVEEFAKLKPGSEVLVPLANGIFAKARLLEVDNVKVNVGSSVLVSKSIEDTGKIMERQVIELRRLKEQSSEEFDKLVKKAEALASEFE